MISEPELAEDWPEDGPAGPARPAPAGEAGEAVRGPARPWLWALGGAVLASAVWAGAWAVQDRFVDAGPPIAYRHSEDLCKDASPRAVGALAGGFEAGVPYHAETPALDWSYCSSGVRWVEGHVTLQAQTVVESHHTTDPGPEFGEGPGFDPDLHSAAAEAERVPGLGERALISEYGMACRIQVLDGGVVFSITVRWYGREGDPEPDRDALKAAMIEDARELMDALRK
ncbi:hypothetical protein [Streptomyces sp. NPDC060031]|uniref:hypothetical protein n=1 Tax=Streptomyces sp. NPDC060031 TaxID=3347043 RepID=UPI0036926D93